MPEGESPSRIELQAPYTLAMVICDLVHRDPGTGKFTLLGCFSAITARSFPATHPAMAIYVALTDGRGRIPIKLRLVDVDEERQPIFELATDIEFQDPRTVMELAFYVGNIVFPSPGEYRLQLKGGDTPMMERRIVLIHSSRELHDERDAEPEHD